MIPLLQWRRLRTLDRRELTWLLGGLGACLLLLAFFSLAGEVLEGDTQALDTKILLALRNPGDPSRPIGPEWVELALLDLTALGGPTVLGLVVCSVAGFLCLQRRYRTATVVAVTAISGELVETALKRAFMRPRPSIVPHLRDYLTQRTAAPRE